MSVKKQKMKKSRQAFIPPSVTLASWQLRRMWGLLSIVGIGILAAVIIVCVAPLYSQIATTAGLRDTLNRPSPTQSSNTIFSTDASKIQPATIQRMQNVLSNEMQQKIGSYLGPSHLSLESSLYTPVPGLSKLTGEDLLRLISVPMDQARQHIKLEQGSLPRVQPDAIEVALTAETAKLMGVSPGSIFGVKIATVTTTVRTTHVLTLRVSGIIQPPSAVDPFWHGNTFVHNQKNDFARGNLYSLLLSNEALLPHLASLLPNPTGQETLELPVHVFWIYSLDTARVTSEDITTLLQNFSIIQADVANHPDLIAPGVMERVSVTAPVNQLQQYHDQSSVLLVTVGGLVAVIFVLILYFVALMTDFLIERQGPALAVLRSRGASGGQILWALMLQGMGVSLLAVLVGPLLALLVVRLLALQLLQRQDRSALDLLLNNPGHVLGTVWLYVLGTAIVALLTLLPALSRTSIMDVLSMRREQARSTHKPFWQRLNLDLVAIIVMVIGYAITFYTTSSGVLDPHLSLILYSPLILARTAFTILAAILIFLRIFPYILRLVSRLTIKTRSAAPMVALAQMARAPGQSVRMTMLLALATAITIFSLIFYSSQLQRAYDVAAFQAGADFNGTPIFPVDRAQLVSRTNAYRQIAGVNSVSLGYSLSGLKADSAIDFPVDLRAVDAATYAQTAIWPANNSDQSLETLMAGLAAQRANALAQNKIPAIVDSELWDSMRLKVGQQFTLSEATLSGSEMHFVAVARVEHIPTISSVGGVLVDFLTFAGIYDHLYENKSYIPIKANTVWLRTNDDASSLANVRAVLAGGDLQLSPLNDRRAMIDTLHREPLYLDLVGILTLGATTALLLALVGNLIASWLSARGRLSNFAVLRALGAAPQQIASTLSWEQAIIYSTSIILGVLFGALLSASVVPVLLFTSPTNTNLSSQDFYLLQNVPPIQIIVPALSGIALAVIVGICIVALGMMVRVVSRPSVGQVLRLSED